MLLMKSFNLRSFTEAPIVSITVEANSQWVFSFITSFITDFQHIFVILSNFSGVSVFSETYFESSIHLQQLLLLEYCHNRLFLAFSVLLRHILKFFFKPFIILHCLGLMFWIFCESTVISWYSNWSSIVCL